MLTRREFIALASALALAPNGSAAAPARLLRRDCYFGLHFDLHPNAADKDLGRDLTDAMVAHLLETVRPDFIQYDSKGHPGYLGFPSKTGMSAPGIVLDSLAVWRRVTAAHGVALYNHFSGVLDGLAVERHPDWARMGPDGKTDPQQTSLFGPYEEELMIPELTEAALNYDLDGSWVDGDCWAVKPEYREACRLEFKKKTGMDTLPRRPEDPGWIEFLELQREAFRGYVARYVNALHRAKPGYQITSNWMYSTFAPERPTLPLDYLSGDIADKAALRQARIQARYLSRCGKPWDLMSWGFESDSHFERQSAKPVMELEQEAAVVLAQGGAYQIYFVPTRAGWIDDRVVNTAAELAHFCRQRQRWCHRSETLPEAGVLYSGRTLYRTAARPFGGWGDAEAPAAGAIDLLLSCGYSADLIPDWQAAESAHSYPLIVVPDWRDIGGEIAGILAAYVADGGNLLLMGAENASLLAGAFNLKLAGPVRQRTVWVADPDGFAQIPGNWIELQAPQEQVLGHAWPSPDSRKDSMPVAVGLQHGKGTVVVCPGPFASTYGLDSSPILQSTFKRMVLPLPQPMVRVADSHPALELVLRSEDGNVLLHFINAAGAPDSSEFRHPGIVPHTGPIHFSVRLAAKPAAVTLEPEGSPLAGDYQNGYWHGILPDLHIHSMVRIAGAGRVAASAQMQRSK